MNLLNKHCKHQNSNSSLSWLSVPHPIKGFRQVHQWSPQGRANHHQHPSHSKGPSNLHQPPLSKSPPNHHHPPNTWPSYEDLDLQFLVTKSTSHHQSQSNHFKMNQNLAKSIRELEIDSDYNWKQLHMFTPSVKLLFMSYFMLTNKFKRSSMFSFWWIAAIDQYIHPCPPRYVC